VLEYLQPYKKKEGYRGTEGSSLRLGSSRFLGHVGMRSRRVNMGERRSLRGSGSKFHDHGLKLLCGKISQADGKLFRISASEKIKNVTGARKKG